MIRTKQAAVCSACVAVDSVCLILLSVCLHVLCVCLSVYTAHVLCITGLKQITCRMQTSQVCVPVTASTCFLYAAAATAAAASSQFAN